jgi:hypothetical protein
MLLVDLVDGGYLTRGSGTHFFNTPYNGIS